MRGPEERASRIRQRLNAGNVNAAARMWEAIPKKQRGDVVQALGEPLMAKLEAELERNEARRQGKAQLAEAAWATRVALQQARIEEENARIAAFAAHLDDVRHRGGCAGREAACSVWQQTRLRALLRPSERIICRDLRAASMRARAVRERLACSVTELDRWDREDRLRHACVRPCQVGWTTVMARTWFADDVDAAIPHVATWRAEDAQRKRARRTKLKLV